MMENQLPNHGAQRLLWQTVTAHSCTRFDGSAYRTASYTRTPDGPYAAFCNVVPYCESITLDHVNEAIGAGTQPLGVFDTEADAVRACEVFCSSSGASS